MTGSNLEMRLRSLEDLTAIQQLKAQYCLFADDVDKAQEFADLFTADAVLDEGEEFMMLHGSDEILAMHHALWPHFKLNQHFAFSPIIELDGDQATGHWRLFQLTTVAGDYGVDKAFWSCGWYDEKYLRINGRWKIREVVARVHFACPYEDGWAKTPFGEFLSREVLDTVMRKIREAS